MLFYNQFRKYRFMAPDPAPADNPPANDPPANDPPADTPPKDNQNSLVIPDSNDSVAWNDFYNNLGRPKSAEDYELSETKDFKRSDESIKNMREAFYQSGLSQKQANDMIRRLDLVDRTAAEKAKAESDQKDQEFDKLVTTVFGQEKDKKQEMAKAVLDKYGTEDQKAHLSKLDDKTAVYVSDIISKIHAAYDKEAPVDKGNPGIKNSDKSFEDQAKELMRSEAYKDSTHENHIKVQKQVTDLFKAQYPEDK